MNQVIIKSENCPECGGAVEVDTSCDEENSFYDGDEARCTECKCKGMITVDDDTNGTAQVTWNN